MQTPLTHAQRSVLLLVVGGIALTGVGCRSTRSSISQLPGMAWVAPGDQETFGQWEDEPSLPTPAQEATPQLATKSGTSPLTSKDAVGDRSGKDEVEERDLAAGEVQYPDTGYPKLHEPASAPQNSGSYTATSATRPGSEYQMTDQQPNRAEPQRGFYGDSYAGDADEEPRSEPAPSRYADPAPSRYSQYSETTPAPGYSRYGSNDDLPPPRSNSTNTEQRVVSDSDSGYDPRGGQPYDRSYDEGPLESYPGAGDLSDTSPPGLADGARRVTQEIREDYEATSEELRSRVQNGAATISSATRELTSDVQDLARQAGDQVERRAAELGRGLQGGYSRFSSGPESPVDAPALAGADPLDASGDPATHSAIPGEAQPGPGLTRQPRSDQPWRPGSTGSYPDAGLDQTRYPTASPSGGQIEPASYPANVSSQPRLTPTYR